jgi:hypothetical protein
MDSYRSPRRRSADSLEEGLDRLVSAGRQLVDGVSGARPGSRRRPAGQQPLPRLGELGRWVEERLDGLLDADDDTWRESWQEPPQDWRRPSAGRRRLDAISRRNQPQPVPSPDGLEGDWPDDASFTLPRWQRDSERRQLGADPLPPAAAAGGRPLPRSSRRRPA